MPGITSTALLSFSHNQHHKTDAAKWKGGGIEQVVTTGAIRRAKPQTKRSPPTNQHRHMSQWKKCSERRKHCVLAVVRRSQKVSPCHRPPSRGSGWPKFNQLEMVTTFTYKFGEDRCTQIRVIVLTDPHTQPQTHKHRQDRLQYAAPLSLRAV